MFDVRHILRVFWGLDFGEFVVRNVRGVDIRDCLLSNVDSLGIEFVVKFDVFSNVVWLEGLRHIVFSVVVFGDSDGFNGFINRDGDFVDQQIGSSWVHEDWVF